MLYRIKKRGSQNEKMIAAEEIKQQTYKEACCLAHTVQPEQTDAFEESLFELVV